MIIDSIAAIYHRSFDKEGIITNSSIFLDYCMDNFKSLVCARNLCQYLNSSKPLQLANMLPIIRQYKRISFPDTLIFKGINNGNIPLPKGRKYITKSISGIRSMVVNQNEFSMWSEDGLSSLPTLFQKQIEGNDVRVHVCHDQVFAVIISNKDRIDYRYSGNSSFKESTIHQESIKFCLATSYLAQNPLIGIDFI